MKYTYKNTHTQKQPAKRNSQTAPYKFILIALLMIPVGCATHKKITYDIPPSIPEATREHIIEQFGKGKELYKIHCSDCHGIFTEGKDKIPNFTNVQLDNYNSRFMMRDPRNHAVAQAMSPDQLNEVLTFLRFLKRDSVAPPTRSGIRR